MLHETVLFDTSPDKCSVLMMCHASLPQQVLFLGVNQKASAVFPRLFMQVSLLKEDLLYLSEIAFKSSSISGAESDKVRAVGCSEKVPWFSRCLHRYSADVILLSLGAWWLPGDQAGSYLSHQRRTPQLISVTVAHGEGLHGCSSRAEVVTWQEKKDKVVQLCMFWQRNIILQLQGHKNVFKPPAGCCFGALEHYKFPVRKLGLQMSLMFVHVLSLFHFVFTMHAFP